MSELLHSFSLSLFIFPLFFISISMAANDSSYPGCPSYSCSGVSIGYPFWLITNPTNTQFCGYQGLGINCSNVEGEDRPMIFLGDDWYHVKNIAKTSIILADNNLVDPGCPIVNHTIDLEYLPLNFSIRNLNLSFHFNCFGSSPEYATDIPCMNYGTRRSYVNVIHEDNESFNWECDDNQVVTTVLDIFSARRVPWEEYARALINGFELNWQRVDDCDQCEESNGRCGHNFNTREFMCFCSGGTTTTDHCKKGFKVSPRQKLVIGISCTSAGMILMLLVYFGMRCQIKRLWVNDKAENHQIETFISKFGSLAPKRFKYMDIKKMTNIFEEKLGQGGYGSVYKGKLSDGKPVAVKLLSEATGDGEDFINEVASIGRTSHVNIVTLIGFCIEGKKRALIYEFMPNGSLDKFLRADVSHLDWKTLFRIAKGIARGLEYLHQGCNTRIVHFDIKPHNVLLDEEFVPKIADFGLAKLCKRKESIVSVMGARGTAGYMAPEVFFRSFGGASHKSDVYSYGMMVLEMTGAHKNNRVGVTSTSSEAYFPDWVYRQIESGTNLGVTTEYEEELIKKMMLVSLWCIQSDPLDRPTISKVMEMLEGSFESLQVPPRRFWSSPARPAQGTSPSVTQSTSGEIL